MKILIAGNSQAACLKRALDLLPTNRSSEIRDADWIVVPGGRGPDIAITKGLINVNINPSHPPKTYPSDQVIRNHIDQYDIIIVSALGWFDGGHQWVTKVTHGHTHAPIKLKFRKAQKHIPVSDSCFREIIFNIFNKMPGFQFLRQLKETFNGKIIVQPFPLISSKIVDNEDWGIAKEYLSPLIAYKYFLEIKDLFLKEKCTESNCILLEYPDIRWRKEGFTPEAYISDPTLLHPNNKYYELVLSQLDAIIQNS